MNNVYTISVYENRMTIILIELFDDDRTLTRNLIITIKNMNTANFPFKSLFFRNLLGSHCSSLFGLENLTDQPFIN